MPDDPNSGIDPDSPQPLDVLEHLIRTMDDEELRTAIGPFRQMVKRFAMNARTLGYSLTEAEDEVRRRLKSVGTRMPEMERLALLERLLLTVRTWYRKR